MPEEFATVSQFAVQIERAGHAKREEQRITRREQLELARKQIAPHFFRVGIEELDLPASLMNALKPLQNIGELQTRFSLDDDPLRHLLERIDPDVEALQNQIKASLALIELTLSKPEAAPIGESVDSSIGDASTDDDPIEVKSLNELEDASQEMAKSEEEEALLLEEINEKQDVEPQLAEEPTGETTIERPQHLQGTARKFVSPAAEVTETIEELELESDEIEIEQERSQKRERQQRRQLIYDEELGKTVVRRLRKSSRRRADWDEYME